MGKKVFVRKKFIILSVIIIFIGCIAAVLLNFNIFLDTDYETEMSLEEKAAIFEPIIENNLQKMSGREDYTDYGNEICRIYISAKDDNVLRKQILSDLQELSDEICSGCQNDYEKVKAIAYWVSDNVYYNEIAAGTSVDSDTISLETVMDTHTTTCAGYSNTFSALCSMQGLYCLNLRGGTLQGGTEPEKLQDRPISHEWNAVMVDNEWIYVDTTWISKNTYDEDGYHKYDDHYDEYFDMSAEFMGCEHRIDLIDHRDFKNAFE